MRWICNSILEITLAKLTLSTPVYCRTVYTCIILYKYWYMYMCVLSHMHTFFGFQLPRKWRVSFGCQNTASCHDLCDTSELIYVMIFWQFHMNLLYQSDICLLTHTHTHIYFQSANHSSPFLLRISIHSQILSHVCIIFLLFIRHTPPPTHQTCLMCCCCSIACHSNHFAQSSHFTRFWFLALPLRCVFIFGPLLILLPVCVIWMWGKCDSRSAEQRWLLVI